MESAIDNPSSGDHVLKTEILWSAYFEAVHAVTPEMLDRVYTLRYRVYCVEHHFENPARFPYGRESDEYDNGSHHVALLSRASGEVVGTGRLIMARPGAESPLPLWSMLTSDALKSLYSYPLDQIGEISRYAVSKSLRRRTEEEEFPDIGFSPANVEYGRRLMPNITLGLIRGLLLLGTSKNIRYFCACMRPALLRLLRQLGFDFHPIGPLIDHHGLRQPCVARVDDLLLGLAQYGSDFRSLSQR